MLSIGISHDIANKISRRVSSGANASHRFFLSVFSILLLFFPLSANAKNVVSNVRLWQAPDHTRIVFDLKSPVDHQIFSLKEPDRLVVDLHNIQVNTDISKLSLKDSPINSIRGAQKKDEYRIVFDLKKALKPQSFVLPPNSKYGNRLVIDLYETARKVVKTEKDLAASSKRKARKIIVAIDAGHGGEDPGARGGRGTLEKVVVLQIAKELQRVLKGAKGIKPYLTRKGDYYLSLSDRPKLAKKKYKADIFISIHADAFTDPRAKGASVYALSRDGASSSTASYLAEKENQSDLIGGVRIDEKDSMVRNVIVDLIMEGSLEHSIYMGEKMLAKMGGIGKLHKSHVEQAGFRVLKSPDMVSVLVETGFISNPSEEKKLKSKAYQKKLAKALYMGLDNYLKQYPIPGTYYANISKQSKHHVIGRGDTLSGIAVRYGVSLSALKKANGLKNNNIKIGQKMLIPAS